MVSGWDEPGMPPGKQRSNSQAFRRVTQVTDSSRDAG